MTKKHGFAAIISGIGALFLLLFGISGAFFASLGTCAFCWIPVLGFMLSFFGLSVGLLLDYNKYFIGFGILIFAVMMFFIINKKRFNCKNGKCKIKSQNKHK